jgi:eukaryotic-like serine/threonine-protein kinase
MPHPPIGAEVETTDGIKAKVLKELGTGGQGTVYLVNYAGKQMALKWYHDSTFADPATGKIDMKKLDGFYENLKNNVQIGSPSSEFLWPLAITKKMHGSFGYIMELRPERFVQESTLLVGRRVHFNSYVAIVQAMINMANAFRNLHNKGFSYSDLNAANFFFDPNTGELLVCDNDNASYPGYNTGILGIARYMAPEVVMRYKLPDTQTDRYSLAVHLFSLLFRHHPLEGAKGIPASFTAYDEKRIYGEDPVFIFDPTDESNRPVCGVGDAAVNVWNKMPQYIRQLFERAFSKECLFCDVSEPAHNSDGSEKPFSRKVSYRANRVSEKEWIEALTHLRSNILRCPFCGRENFVINNLSCSKCKGQLSVSNLLVLPKYNVAVYPGQKIYRIQLDTLCSDKSSTEIIAEVIDRQDKGAYLPQNYQIKNCSSEIWDCTTTRGTKRPLAPGETMPAKAGITAQISGGSFRIG